MKLRYSNNFFEVLKNNEKIIVKTTQEKLEKLLKENKITEYRQLRYYTEV